jgi:dihydrofolate reductase
MICSLIVAMTRSGVMGVNNQLPWSIPEDLKRFKELTLGKPVIMGRKTFESIGRVLPGRHSIVISRNAQWEHTFVVPTSASVNLSASLESALDRCSGNPEVFVLGGSEIFSQALEVANRAYITWVEKEIFGDVYFPDPGLRSFRSVSREHRSGPIDFTFESFVR